MIAQCRPSSAWGGMNLVALQVAPLIPLNIFSYNYYVVH